MLMLIKISDVKTRQASIAITAVMTLFSEMEDGKYIIIILIPHAKYFIILIIIIATTQHQSSRLRQVPLHPGTSPTRRVNLLKSKPKHVHKHF